MDAPCPHFAAATHLTSEESVCPECVAIGSPWVHLRVCMICGHVGCCDNSPNKHARRHFEGSGDAVVRSIEPDEVWGYCFADDAYVEDVQTL